MVPPKYEFTGEVRGNLGRVLKRIRRLSDGLVGGWIEHEENLSHEGSCFVYDYAQVSGYARVQDDAQARNTARVSDHAILRDHAQARGKTWINGHAILRDRAVATCRSWVGDRAMICDEASLSGDAAASDDAVIGGTTQVRQNAWLRGSTHVRRLGMVFNDSDRVVNVTYL